MHEPNIEKLRRFSLVVGLILLTYSFAGISLDPRSGINVVGLAFKVAKPQLLPLGFIIASLYGVFSFYYYGFMLKKSPYRVRRDVIDQLNVREPTYVSGKKVSVYFGQSDFETPIGYSNPEKVEHYVANFPEMFPKFAGSRASAESFTSSTCDEDGDPYISYSG